VVRTEDPLLDRESLFEKSVRLVEPLLPDQVSAEHREARSGPMVIGAEPGANDRQRVAIVALRFLVPSLLVLNRPEVDEVVCDVRMPRTVDRLVHREHALRERFGVGPVPLIEVCVRQLVKSVGQLR
jgi:hypothetical protein